MENTKTKKSKRKIAYEIFNILVWLLFIALVITTIVFVNLDTRYSDSIGALILIMFNFFLIPYVIIILGIGINDINSYYKKKSKYFLAISINGGFVGFPVFFNMVSRINHGTREENIIAILTVILSILMITQFFMFIIHAIKEKIKKDKDKVEEEIKTL